MSELSEHYCSACGQTHGGHARKDPDVEIARIQAERDVEVARINRGMEATLATIGAETAIETTELEAAAAVAIAEETGPPEAEPEEDTQAIIVEGPPAEPVPEPEPTLEPKGDSLPTPARKHTGYWPS
jgi:hypothetical protein